MTRPLRLLEYITPHSMGGAEHGLLMEIEELGLRGHDLFFVSPQGRTFTGLLRDQGFDIWCPRTFGKLDPLTLVQVAAAVRRRRRQLVHTHLSTASFLGSLAARLSGVPSVASVHGLNRAFCYRFATLVIAVSEAVKRHLVAQGLPADRIRVVHNGVNVNWIRSLPPREEVRAQLGLKRTDRVVLYLGRLSPEKGTLLLPAILERLLQHIPSAHLLVLGTGSLQPELELQLAQRKLRDRSTVVGYRAEIRPYLAAADMLVQPSYKEGLPRALLQGMAAGLPAVGTVAGGIPEVIMPGETGLLAAVGDAHSIADACAETLSDRERARRMGAAARERVHDCFSIERSISGIEKVFHEALSTNVSLERAPGRVLEKRGVRD